MEAIEKLKETALSVLPVAGMVVLLGLTTRSLPGLLLVWFSVGSILVVAGLSIFLLGVDLGISRLGERCGAALTERRNLKLMTAVAFLIGVVVTAAEPDIQVFASQVCAAFPQIGKLQVTAAISLGVGAFLALGVARTVLGISLKWTLVAGYAAVFAIMAVAPARFMGSAFDSSGATTGPLTVPFIMALGLGVSAVRGGKDSGFGLTGVASIGPLLAMLLLARFAERATAISSSIVDAANTANCEVATKVEYGLTGEVWRKAACDVVTSLLPLLSMTVVLQFALIRMSRRQFLRVVVGMVEAGLGLLLFFAGVGCGFMEAGLALGAALGARMTQVGWIAAVLAIAAAMGGAVVCAEPAVWALGDQVERVSGGMIRRKALLVFLASATALATALAALRAFFGFSLAWLLVPGYAGALAMMPFIRGNYTGMAFDSGGVASGPLTTTLILSFIAGIAQGSGNASDEFGVIALVAMMPLLAIQAMGMVIESRRAKVRDCEVAHQKESL